MARDDSPPARSHRRSPSPDRRRRSRSPVRRKSPDYRRDASPPARRRSRSPDRRRRSPDYRPVERRLVVMHGRLAAGPPHGIRSSIHAESSCAGRNGCHRRLQDHQCLQAAAMGSSLLIMGVTVGAGAQGVDLTLMTLGPCLPTFRSTGG